MVDVKNKASRPRRMRLFVLVPAFAVLISCTHQHLATLIARVLFIRPGTASCVPSDDLRKGSAPPLRPLSEEEISAFERDGSVILRGILDDIWVERLHALVQDVFVRNPQPSPTSGRLTDHPLLHCTQEHPNVWDVLYSRFIANFYCAQKSILVHHTSKCGREIAEAAPTTAIAAALLRSGSLQVCEPTDALANFRRPTGSWVTGLIDGCGTTGFHTDDAYIAVGRRDASRAAVVRLWMPLAPFTSAHFRFATLNESKASRSAREAAGLSTLNGTSYLKNEQLTRSGVLEAEGQVIQAAGMRPGDILAFAGETAHIASAIDCGAVGAGGCLRLILSFSGDNAAFVGGRSTGLIPLHDNQTEGARPQGVQFPTVHPDARAEAWEWAPLLPSPQTLISSFWFAIRTGARSFAGFSARKQLVYVARVAWFTLGNFWEHPAPRPTGEASGAGATHAHIVEPRAGERPSSLAHSAVPLSLTRHFGGAVIAWAMGSK